MGSLTGDMMRLRQEISVLRDSRETLMRDLGRMTKTRKSAVAGMRAGFRTAHAQMARDARTRRAAFVTDLKKAVFGMRKEFADDLAGAHRAWIGKGF